MDRQSSPVVASTKNSNRLESAARSRQPANRASATVAPIIQRFNLAQFSEALVWLCVITVVILLRIFTAQAFKDITTVWIIGVILAFALLYYTVIYQAFNDKQRHYIKDIADVVFIGVLGYLAKDYSIYFFSLYILPIASAAMALDMLNSLGIAVIASLFIAGNIVLNTSFSASPETIYFGTFQIGLLLVMTLFTRALALQLRSEQQEREFFAGRLREVDSKLQDVEALEQEFVSITTHQLNTPLSIIRGYTSMLMEGDAGALSAKQKRYVTEVHSGSLRLTKMIQDLLSITHLDRDQFLAHNHKPIDLNSILPPIVSRLQQKAVAANVKLSFIVPNERLVIMGNDTHLAEAVSNLVDNAVKYSAEGATVTLSLSKEKGVVGTDVVMSVTDQGIGIPEEEQGRIFQRFYRASNSDSRDAQGTGLGLYIVKRIIEHHGGSISFTSKLNQGTTFKIRFPLVKLTADTQTAVPYAPITVPINGATAIDDATATGGATAATQIPATAQPSATKQPAPMQPAPIQPPAKA